MDDLEDVYFLIAGDSPERNILETLVEENAQDRIRFLSEVPHEALPGLY